MQSLEDVLNGNEPTEEPTNDEIESHEAEPEEVATAEEDAPAASEEPESDPKPAEPSVDIDALQKELNGFKSAYLDEKRKRQAYEQQSQKEPEKAPDIFEDQEAYTSYVQNTVNQAVLNAQANLSEYLARKEYPDLDDKVEAFKELAAKNPALQQQVLAAQSPYHELVDVVMKHQELEQMKDLDSYKAKIRAEIEAEIRGKVESEASEKAAKREKVEAITPSLANARSTAKTAEQNYNQSLDELFGR